jgi:hypothetical protein
MPSSLMSTGTIVPHKYIVSWSQERLEAFLKPSEISSTARVAGGGGKGLPVDW